MIPQAAAHSSLLSRLRAGLLALSPCSTPSTAPPLVSAATALAAVALAVAQVRERLDELLFLAPDIVLALRTSFTPLPLADTYSKQNAVRRVLDIDAGLRALLAAEEGALDRCRLNCALGSSSHLAPVLAEKELVSFRLMPSVKAVAFESDLVRRAVAATLASPEHAHRLELAHKLLHLQAVELQLTYADAAWESAAAAWASAARESKAEAASSWFGLHVERHDELTAEMKATGARVAALRPLLPTAVNSTED